MKNNENVNIQAQSIRGQNSSHVRIRIENKSDAEICVAMWFAGWKPQQKFHMSAKSVEGLMPTHVAVGAELGFVVDLGGEPIQELDQLGITDGRNRFWHVCSEELAEIIEHSTADAKLWPPPDKSLLEGRLRECSVAIKALLIERIDEDKQLEIRFTNQSNMPIHLTGAILEWKYANPVEHKESGPGKPRVALAGGSINLTPNFRIESPVQPNQSVAFIPDRRLVSAIAQVNEEVGDNGINVTVFTDTKLAWVETGNGIAAVVRSFADHISKHLPVPSNAGSPLGNNLPFVLWSIPCFDREREKPLPVFNRSYVLEWSELDHAQLREVIEILGSRKSDDLIPSNLDSVVFKMSRTPSMPDDRMLKYRKYFKEIDGSSLQSMFDASRASQLIFVDLNRDYFEDENGNEVTHYEMIAQVTGNERPILLGDPGSVIKLGRSAPKPDCNWTVEKANTLAQFIDVVTTIGVSRWYSRENSYTLEIAGDRDNTSFPSVAESELLEAIYPDNKDTMEVLAYFRQLHAGDKLVVKASEIFRETCSDTRKSAWILERENSFAATVDSKPVPFDVKLTRRQLIQAFMYGAGLLHADSKHGDDVKLKELVKEHGRERTLFIFNHCLHDIFAIAVDICRVVRLDFEHWLNEYGLAEPTRFEIKELFRDSATGRRQ